MESGYPNSIIYTCQNHAKEEDKEHFSEEKMYGEDHAPIFDLEEKIALYPKCFDNRRASATNVRTGLAAELNGITDISHT